MIYISVGSVNPVKLNAVRQACTEKLGAVSINGFDVPSGVAAQPRTDAETRRGAEQRARAALASGLAEYTKKPNASVAVTHLGVGLEGGVCEIDRELWSTVWVAVADQDGGIFTCNGARFRLPNIIADRIRAGEEMGPVMASLFGGKPISTTNGMIGVVTADYVSRAEEYGTLAKLAIGLWQGRNWTAPLDNLPEIAR